MIPAPALPALSHVPARYRTSVARPHEMAAARTLRTHVLADGRGSPTGPTPPAPQEHVDEWDDLCDHLVVRDDATDEVVATCHLLPPERAMALGRSYADGRFDLSRHERLRPWTVAAGRTYVHPAHRSTPVINRLAAGVLRYVAERGHPFLAGCVSVPLTDGGSAAAGTWSAVRTRHLAPAALRVVPHLPFDVEVRLPGRPVLPPLLRASVRGGGLVCGRPAHDGAAGTAEFYVVLPLTAVAARAVGGRGEDRR